MFALGLIGAGVVCDLVLVALLALAGGGLKLGGMMILEPRRRVG